MANLSEPLDGADDDTDAGKRQEESSLLDVDEQFASTLTTLVEVVPGTAVLFGAVPDGVELVDFGLVPSSDRALISTTLSAMGNTATVAGNLTNAVNSAQGLYRVNEATLALLKSGGQLAAKDGANLGAIFVDGKLVAQARLIPYGVTAAQTIAALGPAIAMIALQMQLSEVSGLVRSNIALTSQTLKAIRHEQWAELVGLADTIDRAIAEANEIESVTKSLWQNVAGSDASLRKQHRLYRQNVNAHIQQLGKVGGHARREYLETNAETILFDSNALLISLKAHTGYMALRAARARTEGINDEHEARLLEVITREARESLDSGLRSTAQLVETLARELRIIAELPGRVTIPLTKKRRDARASRLTCAELLAAIEPLSTKLSPMTEDFDIPEVVCAPENFDVRPYLRILRWFLEDGEKLRGLAFPYQPGSHDLVAAVPFVQGKRVDATWSALAPGTWAAVRDKAASSTVVAITDRRVMTAPARALLQHGEIGSSFLLSDVRYVRVTPKRDGSTRTSLDVITHDRNRLWIFPAMAEEEKIGEIAALLDQNRAIDANEGMVVEGARMPIRDGAGRGKISDPRR